MNFFTSDQHFFHDNIRHLCNRPFENMTQMIDTIISNHNAVVSDRDEVWNLGDFSYKADPENVVKVLKRLNGKQNLLVANHDKATRIAYEKGLLKDLIASGKIEIIGGNAILDRSLSISKMINVEGQSIFISHYPHTSYPMAFRKSIMAHGHCHGNLPISKYRIIDVGVDPNNFFPISFAHVMEIMKAKSEFAEKEDLSP
jgi:calcineurin-like phosphoesterase family protein